MYVAKMLSLSLSLYFAKSFTGGPRTQAAIFINKTMGARIRILHALLLIYIMYFV